MATLKELEDALLKADAAKDTASATILANEIRRLRAQGGDAVQPERAGSTVGGVARNFVSNIGQGSVSLINTLSELPALAEDKAAGWMGVTPEQMDALRQTRAAVGVGTPRRGGDVQAKIQEDVTGPYYQSQGTVEDYAGTLGNWIPGLLTGPGKTTVQAVKSGVLPMIFGAGTSETAGQVSEGTWFEPYARFVGGLGGSLFGAGLNNWAGKPSAPIADISPKAQARVGNALNDSFGGNVGRALARGDELGNEAMLFNLGERPLSQAVTIAKQPGEGSAILKNAVTEQLDGSGRRALTDWENSIGTSVSRFERELQTQATKAGTGSIYEVAKGRPVNPAPVKTAIGEQLLKAGNDTEARAVINNIENMLIDPRGAKVVIDPRSGMRTRVSGKSYISDAGDLVNVRQKISEEIEKIGKEYTVNPGDDLFKVGSRTSLGRKLLAIRQTINEVLHEDDTLKAADTIWSSAEKTKNAFDLGNKKLLGRGDSYIEPEAFDALLANPNLTLEETTAMLQGLSRRGKTLLGDVRNNQNDGKAMGDAIATGNNLARIKSIAGPDASDTVQKMANREDLFAAQGNRVTSNSVTAEAQAGQAEFPSPLLGGPQYGQLMQTSLLGAPIAAAVKLGDALTRGAISRNRSQLSADAAALLTKTGPERDKAVRRLMDYSSKLPKGHPLKTVIAQAINPVLVSAGPALLGGR
jgi:hypothetical protein